MSKTPDDAAAVNVGREGVGRRDVDRLLDDLADARALISALETMNENQRRNLAGARECVAAWMMRNGYATGHGDSIESLIGELDWQHRNLTCATSGTHKDVAAQILAACNQYIERYTSPVMRPGDFVTQGAIPRVAEIVRANALYWRDDALRNAASIILRYEVSAPICREIADTVMGLCSKGGRE